MARSIDSIAEHCLPPRVRPGHGITDNESRYPATTAIILQKKTINFRLILVCLAAASVGLPIAIISIAKFLLLLGGTAILLGHKPAAAKDQLRFTPIAVLLVLAAFAISLLWTTAPTADAMSSLGKYGKLLMIPLIVALLRTRAEVICALGAFALAQLFLMVSSWMLFFHLPVPWATSPPVARLTFAVFSSYLDEGIMTAVFAGVCWHLRALVPGRYGRHCAVAVAAVALVNVFFVFDGRSGHVVAIVLMSLAVMWALPVRYRIGIVLLPFLLLLIVSLISPKVQTRVEQVRSEVQAFSLKKGASVVDGTSSGIRLHFWHRAIQSMLESPVLGSGVGSWSSEFNRIERQQNSSNPNIAEMGNPHQEYLLWGVQLGIPGILLIVALMISILRDTLGMEKMAARAAQSVLAALAVACLFNSTIYDALIGDFFCVALGLLLALGVCRPAAPSIGPGGKEQSA